MTEPVRRADMVGTEPNQGQRQVGSMTPLPAEDGVVAVGQGEHGRENLIETLKSRCKKGMRGRPLNLDLSGLDLSGEDLSGLDLSGYDLSRANMVHVKLTGSNLGWAKLVDTNLHKAVLTDCEMVGADLTGANLSECSAERAGLGATSLVGASMIGANLRHGTLSEANLTGADLRAATLETCNIRSADMTGATLTRADLQGADLQQSNVMGASFEVANLQRARLLGIRNYTQANWIGTDIREIDLRGAYLIRRFISDENYLYEFRSRSKYHAVLYRLWWLTSDCGRSLLRWTLCVVAVTVLFAVLYAATEVDYGRYRTLFSPLYYSVVTLTTLGYGDVVPASGQAQVIASIQAVLGYVGLGGFLSILANKMARRAD
jgi:uncharacterized protein YjbI with pentapeptide repeats